MAITWRTAVKVWLRDGAVCRYCSDELTPDQAEIDHVMPRSLGGTDTIENLALACKGCNRAKSDKHPRWAEWWLVDGHPWCVARASYEFEVLGVDDGEQWPWMVGGEFFVDKDGTRRVTRLPMGSGVCGWTGCPDCTE